MNDKIKILVFSPYPKGGAPSQRFRYEQYTELLSDTCSFQVNGFWSQKANEVLYQDKKYVLKTMATLSGIINSWKNVLKCRSYDVIWIHREIMPVGWGLAEFVIARCMRKQIIYDFDDAIWQPNFSDQNRMVRWLKRPAKTKNIIRYASAVVVGNQFLKSYALQFNQNVFIIPTTIDLKYHHGAKKNNAVVIIGWTGSKTTVPHFKMAEPVLLRIIQKYGDRVALKLIGDDSYFNSQLGLKGEKWSQQSEISELLSIDIGIMPLPADGWAEGKCGFKGLQYMALGIPSVMSPVGVNVEIISDGVNGFLPKDEDEWFEVLCNLIDNANLRKSIGKAGHETIVKNYAVEGNVHKYREVIEKVYRSSQSNA